MHSIIFGVYQLSIHIFTSVRVVIDTYIIALLSVVVNTFLRFFQKNVAFSTNL
nr:MAG TPA: hypothetical protein [Caudoviricetes sp.]